MKSLTMIAMKIPIDAWFGMFFDTDVIGRQE